MLLQFKTIYQKESRHTHTHTKASRHIYIHTKAKQTHIYTLYYKIDIYTHKSKVDTYIQTLYIRKQTDIYTHRKASVYIYICVWGYIPHLCYKFILSNNFFHKHQIFKNDSSLTADIYTRLQTQCRDIGICNK